MYLMSAINAKKYATNEADASVATVKTQRQKRCVAWNLSLTETNAWSAKTARDEQMPRMQSVLNFVEKKAAVLSIKSLRPKRRSRKRKWKGVSITSAA